MKYARWLLLIGIGALVLLGSAGNWSVFLNPFPVFFILFYVISGTVLTGGVKGLSATVRGAKLLRARAHMSTTTSQNLLRLYRRQLWATYSAGIVAFGIGAISIHFYASKATMTPDYSYVYAVNLVSLFYTVIVAEFVFRPLLRKLQEPFHFSI